jgi:hypothetical protein
MQAMRRYGVPDGHLMNFPIQHTKSRNLDEDYCLGVHRIMHAGIPAEQNAEPQSSTLPYSVRPWGVAG